MNQTNKVYDAELAVRDIMDRQPEAPTYEFYGSNLVLPIERKFGNLDDVQAYVDAVLALPWVKDTFYPSLDVSRPVKVRARTNAKSAHYEPATETMAMPDHGLRSTISWAMREIVVLHELAHHLVYTVEPHGPRFVGAFIKLLSEIVGQELGLIMTSMMTDEGAKIEFV